MAAIIKLTSQAGEIEFSATSGREPPIVGRRLEYNRAQTDQGSSYQRVLTDLAGFVEGNNHTQITTKLDEIRSILESNEVTLYYHDGAREVINEKVWVDNFAEAAEWKEFFCNYTISLHSFRNSNHADQFTVSYAPTVNPLSNPAYVFESAPSIARAFKPNRKNMRVPQLTPSGVDLGDMVELTLEGHLMASTPQDLEAKRVALCAALRKDGQLNYGDFYTVNARAIDVTIPSVYPKTYLNYSIKLGYDSGDGVSELEISREWSRLHYNPLIKEYPYCPNQLPTVQLRNVSGQVINYTMRAVGYDTPALWNFLANEASFVVAAGGTEMPGGTQAEIIYGGEPAVMARFSKFHREAVFGNLDNT